MTDHLCNGHPTPSSPETAVRFGGCPSCGRPGCIARQCQRHITTDHNNLAAHMALVNRYAGSGLFEDRKAVEESARGLSAAGCVQQAEPVGVVESALSGAGGFHCKLHGNRMPAVGAAVYLATPPATVQQECGHPSSLILTSAETGEPLYCEACDDKSGRRDAEAREVELMAEIAALKQRAAQLAEITPEEWEWLKHPQSAADLAEFAREYAVRCAPPATVQAEQDRLDAERYRWLRKMCEMPAGGLTIAKTGGYYLAPWSGDDPDQAIDAARASEGAQG